MKRFFLIFLLFSAHAVGASEILAANAPDTMEERVKPCIVCHGPEDKKGRDAYYPRIAGKPQGYLFNQLRNFRDGRRLYRPMAVLLEGLPDQYLRGNGHVFCLPEASLSPAGADEGPARRN